MNPRATKLRKGTILSESANSLLQIFLQPNTKPHKEDDVNHGDSSSDSSESEKEEDDHDVKSETTTPHTRSVLVYRTSVDDRNKSSSTLGFCSILKEIDTLHPYILKMFQSDTCFKLVP